MIIILIIPAHAGDESGNDTGSLRRKTPSGHYIDPASFFRFHGYITLTNAVTGDDLGSETGMTPHILISGFHPELGKNVSGFKNDAALFVGGEPFEGVGSVIEIHFVGNAMDPVITEAKVMWDIIEGAGLPYSLRIVAGRFWWAFGIHNDEWFSAINEFNVISPAAGEVLPAHYNEVGLMAEGEYRISKDFGLNYVLSIGNGVPGFELMGNVMNTSEDNNKRRAYTGRLGLVLQQELMLELGLSFGNGQLRSTGSSLEIGKAEYYKADYNAYGADLTLEYKNVNLRSYLYHSEENLWDSPINKLRRTGYTFEPKFTFDFPGKRFKNYNIVGRYSSAVEDNLNHTEDERIQYGIALNINVPEALWIKFGYVVQDEGKSTPQFDNNVFSFSLTSDF